MRQPQLPAALWAVLQRLQALQRGAEIRPEGNTGCIGHGPALLFDRLTRRLVGARKDVLHCLDLGLLCQCDDLGFERGQLIGKLCMSFDERLARLCHRRLLCLGPIDHPPQIADGLGNQYFAGRAGCIHDTGLSVLLEALRILETASSWSAAKQASSSGTTPLANRRVARRWARARRSVLSVAAAISAV